MPHDAIEAFTLPQKSQLWKPTPQPHTGKEMKLAREVLKEARGERWGAATAAAAGPSPWKIPLSKQL